MQQNSALWQSVLGEIELSVSHGNFETWFKYAELIELTDQSATIGVTNIFAKAQFEKKFDKQLKEVFKNNGLVLSRITYQVKDTKKRILSRETTQIVSDGPPAHTLDNAKYGDNRPISLTQLNPKYNFENFVVGASNDLAYTASQAVVSNPGKKYNPMFIYGGVGLGKTHLIQAVGNAIKTKDPRSRVMYINTDTFVKEFLDYVRFKKVGFSNKYRKVDVLIVDDIQFIAGKEKTQEEFFHTFNELHQADKQIIISSDKPPHAIPTLTERLRSRLEWGMAIDIQMPDFETRYAIVKNKAMQSGIDLDPETIEYFATNYKSNIRELEGALNQLLALAEMRGISPDIATVEGMIGNAKRSRPRHLTAKQIVDKTARHFQLDVKEICSSKRDKYIVVPRQIAMYLLRSELHMSFPRIAVELGRKDHTTAIHSVEKIDKAIKLDIMIREQVAEIRDKLYA